MNLNDPLVPALSQFTAHILGSINAAAPYAAACLVGILVLYGVMRATR